MKRATTAAPPIVWERTDPAKLAVFNPSTKVCTMNCGPHRANKGRSVVPQRAVLRCGKAGQHGSIEGSGRCAAWGVKELK